MNIQQRWVPIFSPKLRFLPTGKVKKNSEKLKTGKHHFLQKKLFSPKKTRKTGKTENRKKAENRKI